MRILFRINALVHGVSAVYALILEAIPALLFATIVGHKSRLVPRPYWHRNIRTP